MIYNNVPYDSVIIKNVVENLNDAHIVFSDSLNDIFGLPMDGYAIRFTYDRLKIVCEKCDAIDEDFLAVYEFFKRKHIYNIFRFKNDI